MSQPVTTSSCLVPLKHLGFQISALEFLPLLSEPLVQLQRIWSVDHLPSNCGFWWGRVKKKKKKKESKILDLSLFTTIEPDSQENLQEITLIFSPAH